MVLQAWIMDNDVEADQRKPHQQSPNKPVSLEQLARIGVLYWTLDVSAPPETNEQLNAIRKERGYTYTDTITISPEKLENYEGKLKIFFKEHLHTDEEIRLILVRVPSGFLFIACAQSRFAIPAVRSNWSTLPPFSLHLCFSSCLFNAFHSSFPPKCCLCRCCLLF
jgi:1,2-dihydroxy-3-keto-5-methylthiopentene dioxygenase